MKTDTMELHSTLASEAVVPAFSLREKLSAYLELTKPRITFLIVLTSAAGFCLGSPGAVDYVLFTHAMIGIALLSSGIATINQFMERDLDALMRRTEKRPLPTGRLLPFEALWFGLALTLTAEVYLASLVNLLTAVLGLTIIAGYLLLYTPLKTRTTLSTVVGAFPGAMPPLIGWAAARGQVGIAAWVLFAILFLWQFPHFLAIAWMYREDYGRAGIRMLPVVEPEGRVTGQQIVAFTIMLIPVSLLPAMMGISGRVYLVAAIVLGLLFLVTSVRAALSKSNQHARQLLLASVLYLPLLFGVMVLNR
jgi:protoheme IX farnesyltransferase